MPHRITTLEKSGRFDLLPPDFKQTGLHRWHFFMDTQFFFVQAISQSSSRSLFLKGFICLECQMIIVSVELRKGNCRNGRNIATVLRAMIKSHNCLKGRIVFVCGFSGRNVNCFSKFAGKSSFWGPFIVKLHHVMSYKRLLDQLYQKRNTYTVTFTQLISVNFEKKYDHDY